MNEILRDADPSQAMNPSDMLGMAERLPAGGMLFFLNTQRFIADNVDGAANIIQGIWNLRDPYKATRRTLVMLW